MSTHTPHDSPRGIERRCDVAVIGGSAAGLAAALQVGRHHRSVIVIDAGDSGTAPDSRLDGDLGHEGPPPAEPTAASREEVRINGGEILRGRAVNVSRTDDHRIRIELAGGHAVVARRVLGVAGLVDEMPGIEDLAEPLHADADGSDVGAAISLVLDNEDIDFGTRQSGNQADWEQRYGGDQMWSGNPNGTLVNQVATLAPGRALDVGAGEGGDAIWLAQQGWNVTASDISQHALDRIARAATERGLAIECHHADANEPGVFESGAFDLVSAQYASIPRTADDRGIANLVGAVAPRGLLLVVSHDLAAMRATIDTQQHSQAFDPDAYVTVDHIVEAVAGSPDWSIEVHQKVPRPPGAIEAASHHVDDIVLRARRHPI